MTDRVWGPAELRPLLSGFELSRQRSSLGLRSSAAHQVTVVYAIAPYQREALAVFISHPLTHPQTRHYELEPRRTVGIRPAYVDAADSPPASQVNLTSSTGTADPLCKSFSCPEAFC